MTRAAAVRLAALAILAVCPLAQAAVIAVLHTGFRMPADKVVCQGQSCVLHMGEGRFEVAASAVAVVEV